MKGELEEGERINRVRGEKKEREVGNEDRELSC